MELRSIFIISFLIISLHFTAKLSAQNMPRAEAMIAKLCSKDYSGRAYAYGGDKKAAAGIYNVFDSLGLKKFTNTYYQQFRFPINAFKGKLSLKLGDKALKPGHDFIINPLSVGGRGRFKVLKPSVAALTQKGSMEREVLLKTDLTNKVLFIENLDSRGIFRLEEGVLRHLFTARAFIFSQKKLTYGMSQIRRLPPTFEILESSIPADFDFVDFEVNSEMIQDYNSQNVIGYVEGTEKPEEFFVFSAHYDHLGQMGDDTYFPGANDNAAGVALMLELADWFKQNPPPFSVAFIAFSGEEVRLLGSKHYTDNPLFPLKSIKFLLNLDLVGTGEDGFTVVNGSLFEDDFEKLKSINEEKGYFPGVEKRGEAANSDHYFFSAAGVPAFFIYLRGGIQAYHDVYDKAETLPLTHFEPLFKMVVDFVGEK